jgi:hypothetical protein
MSVDIDKILKKAKELNAKKKNKPQCNSVITGLPAEYKPWYQGDNFSPEEAEKLETSQPPIMEVLVTAAVEEKNSHQNLHFKEDNFMNHDNDIKMDEIQLKTNLVQTEYKPSTGTDRTQIVHKRDSNWSQSGVKLESKWSQTGVKLESKWSQSGVKVESRLLSKSETGVKLESQLESKWSQTGVKVESKQPNYSSLVGLQRAIIFLIYSECQKARSKVTNPLTVEHIKDAINCKKSSIKAAIRRLERKHCISRVAYKNGKGGWSKYTIPDLLFHEMLHLETGVKVESKWSQSGVKVESKVESTPVSSSSYINNKNTTTNGNELPEEWRNINLDPLQDIGFSEKHLRQIFNLNLPDVVEESIKHFAFGLLNNPNAKQYTNPINVIMGVLRKGQAWVENNYKSPQEIAQQELASRKKAEAERLAKLAQEIYDAEFKIWENGLSAEEIKAIEFGTKYCGPLKSRLKACFNETAWATKQNKP